MCQVGTSKINCAEVLQITTMSLGLKAVPLTRFAVYVCSCDSCPVVHCIDFVAWNTFWWTVFEHFDRRLQSSSTCTNPREHIMIITLYKPQAALLEETLRKFMPQRLDSGSIKAVNYLACQSAWVTICGANSKIQNLSCILACRTVPNVEILLFDSIRLSLAGGDGRCITGIWSTSHHSFHCQEQTIMTMQIQEVWLDNDYVRYTKLCRTCGHVHFQPFANILLASMTPSWQGATRQTALGLPPTRDDSA